MSDHAALPPKPQAIVPDIGAHLSGAGIDAWVLENALAVACPIHQVAAGDPCPLVGACLARQSAAPEVL